MQPPSHILFAVSSLGLGHATRTLPVIRHFLEKQWLVSVLAHGNALHFLEQELAGNDVTFIEYEDYPKFEKSLSGRLSHARITDRFKHQWAGLLSSYTTEEVPEAEKIDILFIISGYLQEQKESFVHELIEQAKKISGHKVFVLGDTSSSDVIRMEEEDITLYPVATGILRNTLFNKANLIVSRSGYTTVLDLAEMNKPAVLFATPRQTEQEYLADFLGDNNWYATSHQQTAIKLKSLLTSAKQCTLFSPDQGSCQLDQAFSTAWVCEADHSLDVPVPAAQSYKKKEKL